MKICVFSKYSIYSLLYLKTFIWVCYKLVVPFRLLYSLKIFWAMRVGWKVHSLKSLYDDIISAVDDFFDQWNPSTATSGRKMLGKPFCHCKVCTWMIGGPVVLPEMSAPSIVNVGILWELLTGCRWVSLTASWVRHDDLINEVGVVNERGCLLWMWAHLAGDLKHPLGWQEAVYSTSGSFTRVRLMWWYEGVDLTCLLSLLGHVATVQVSWRLQSSCTGKFFVLEASFVCSIVVLWLNSSEHSVSLLAWCYESYDMEGVSQRLFFFLSDLGCFLQAPN